MGFCAGNNAKVTLGSTVVLGMGNWKITGIATDLLESTAFGDVAKQFLTGLLDYGTVTFSGLYDPADTTGQDVLASANINNSKIANLFLYVNSVSAWKPNTAAVTAAGVLMTGFNLELDKSALGRIDFTGKLTGPWHLV